MRWKSLAELSTLELWAITKRTFSRGKDTSSTTLFRKRLKRPCLRLSSCGPWVSSTLWAEEVVLDWGPNRGWEGQWGKERSFLILTFGSAQLAMHFISPSHRTLEVWILRISGCATPGQATAPNLPLGPWFCPGQLQLTCKKNEWTHDTISFFVKLGPQDHLLWCALMPLFDYWNWIRSKATSDSVSLSMQDTHLEWVITAYPRAQQWRSQRMLKTTYLFRFAGVLDIFGFEASCASFIKNESNQKQVLLGWPSGPVGLKWEPRQVLYYVVDMNM